MASATRGAARERLVAAAMALFSTKGYAATSIGDIQVACGLTAGSGALYKHFPSKRALLEEVLRRHVQGIAAERDIIVSSILSGLDDNADLEEVLRAGAQLVWQAMERDRAVIRITMRDLEPYPDLLNEFWDEVVGSVYRQAAELIKHVVASGRVVVEDPDATAGVLVASLTYFPILHGLIGRTPGDVDADRYLDAWTDHALRSLNVQPREGAPVTRTKEA
jgi:AcrR family transcriptional regulator